MRRILLAIICIACLQSCAVLNDSVSRYSYNSRIGTSNRHLPSMERRSMAPAAASLNTSVSPGLMGFGDKGHWDGEWSPFNRNH